MAATFGAFIDPQSTDDMTEEQLTAIEERLAVLTERLARHDEIIFSKVEILDSTVRRHFEVFESLKTSIAAQQTEMKDMLLRLTKLEASITPPLPSFSSPSAGYPTLLATTIFPSTNSSPSPSPKHTTFSLNSSSSLLSKPFPLPASVPILSPSQGSIAVVSTFAKSRSIPAATPTMIYSAPLTLAVLDTPDSPPSVSRMENVFDGRQAQGGGLAANQRKNGAKSLPVIAIFFDSDTSSESAMILELLFFQFCIRSQFYLPCVPFGLYSCYPKEHYFPVLLSKTNLLGSVAIPLKRFNWTNNFDGHSHQYSPEVVSLELVRTLTKSGDSNHGFMFVSNQSSHATSFYSTSIVKEWLIGDAAKTKEAVNPSKLRFDVKHRQYNYPIICMALFRLIRELLVVGLLPNKKIFSSLFAGFSLMGQLDIVHMLFDEMSGDQDTQWDDIEIVEPSYQRQRTLSALMKQDHYIQDAEKIVLQDHANLDQTKQDLEIWPIQIADVKLSVENQEKKLSNLRFALAQKEDGQSSLRSSMTTIVNVILVCMQVGTFSPVMLAKHLLTGNAMIFAYDKVSESSQAIGVFQFMHCFDMRPNLVIWRYVLPPSCNHANTCCGETMHVPGITFCLTYDATVMYTLVSMHGKREELDSARYLLNSMLDRSLLLWNSMISCYLLDGLWHNSLDIFIDMIAGYVMSDAISMIIANSMCGIPQDLRSGDSFHASIIPNGFNLDVHVMNGLLFVSFACDWSDASLKLFHKSARNAISWDELFLGLATIGDTNRYSSFLYQKGQEGVKFVEDDMLSWWSILFVFILAWLITLPIEAIHATTIQQPMYNIMSLRTRTFYRGRQLMQA